MQELRMEMHVRFDNAEDAVHVEAEVTREVVEVRQSTWSSSAAS